MFRQTTFVMLALVFVLSSAAVAADREPAGVVNINTATVSELSFLPGVGPSKAQAIVKHRKAREFKKIEDIMRVKGIGRKSFRQMRPYLRIKGETTLTKKVKSSR